MALLRFNFLGTIQDEYPESSAQVKYGRGYQFATKPRGPDQISTKINFPNGLFWLEDRVTRVMNMTAFPTLNIGALRAFYETVRMYDVFELDHPLTGVTKYRFEKPFSLPQISNAPGAIGGYQGYRTHQTEAFGVQLISQPL